MSRRRGRFAAGGRVLLALQAPADPLAPRRGRRRHPKMLPDGARDRLVVTWLSDGGFRIGELCGLHLADLHLLENAGCGDCRSPHVHVCHRDGNVNQARAKTKYLWSMEDGVIRGGLVRRAGPAMVHAYFEYMTTEYPRQAGHGMLLVQLHGRDHGQPWAPAAVRGMLRRAGYRAGRGPAARVPSFVCLRCADASGGNLLIARDAGGGPRSPWWMRFTAMSMSTTRCSTRRACRGGGRKQMFGYPTCVLRGNMLMGLHED